jgi:phosphoribosylamine--glycine ligase
MDLPEALAALDDIFNAHGAAVLVEEFMEGEEASFFVLSDGKTALPMGTAQDHKRAYDGDEGPNTGGMGAYSPAPVMTPEVTRKAMEEIVQPTLSEMAARGMPFQGVLFAGLMIRAGQPRLVEYNVRFGDPEMQVLAMRLGGQVLDLLLATAEGRLAEAAVNWADDHALTIIMAARGYPGSYAKGEVIGGLGERSPQVKVFHAGTALEGEDVVSNGGRVLAVTARGDTLKDAHARAYARLKRIDWPGGFARSDIGWRAL